MEEGTRLDFTLALRDGDTAYVEVKNVTWRRDGSGAFPDAVTQRGAKHLETLARLAEKGRKAFMIFIAQRIDIDRLAIAGDVDPGYASAYQRAIAAGVEIRAFRCKINHEAIVMDKEIALV